jgi:cytochrome c peroxidase
MKSKIVLVVIFISIAFVACKKDDTEEVVLTSGPTPYNLVIPSSLPPMSIPEDNPLTVEGVALGKKLFYDPILSINNTQACGDCHSQEYSFSSVYQFSFGAQGDIGTRNSMPILNLGWHPGLFWDGGAANLESQVIGPIQNPVEMHQRLDFLMIELQQHPEYPALFKAAFGTDQITTPLLMKAVAQFERTLISGNSRYDQYVAGTAELTPQEINGMNLYSDMLKGDCNHCHTLGSTFTDFAYRNTGLDSIAVDEGRYKITLNENDKGKFKTPTLRNIEHTGPYMHDGRFNTLLECVEHYNTGFHYASNLDGNLASAVKGRMTQQEMEDIVAFLLTLTDEEFLNNPAFKP